MEMRGEKCECKTLLVKGERFAVTTIRDCGRMAGRMPTISASALAAGSRPPVVLAPSHRGFFAEKAA
jgi:hypothetical protein